MSPSETDPPARQRHWMVESQLRDRGISDERVLNAIAQVPREEFVDKSDRDAAYDDCPLPIGFGQTISQPFTVAFLLQSARLSESDRVLDVGTGSGYAAAIASLLAREVYSVERIPKLAARAQSTLRQLGYDVRVVVSDGTLGLPDAAPFDAIIVAAAAPSIPEPLTDQLAMGGRLVMPVGSYGSQRLLKITRTESGLITEDLGGFVFVPLIGRFGVRDND